MMRGHLLQIITPLQGKVDTITLEIGTKKTGTSFIPTAEHRRKSESGGTKKSLGRRCKQNGDIYTTPQHAVHNIKRKSGDTNTRSINSNKPSDT